MVLLSENTSIGDIEKHFIYKSDSYKNLEGFGGIKTKNSQILD